LEHLFIASIRMQHIQEYMAEEELRKLQVLAGALHNANNSASEPGAYMSQQELSDKMDALAAQLDDFEERFASADPEVRQMLAQLITNPAIADELALASQQTPNSSDSAQTRSTTDSGQERWTTYSSPMQGGSLGNLNSSPQRTGVPTPARRLGGPETSPLFPALTPSNSLAQQTASRESLADCAASSFPSLLPAMVRTSAHAHFIETLNVHLGA
jgi:hypothetical protein